MSETELYEKKENAKAYLQNYLQLYFAAANEYGDSEESQVDEVHDLIKECGKNLSYSK